MEMKMFRYDIGVSKMISLIIIVIVLFDNILFHWDLEIAIWGPVLVLIEKSYHVGMHCKWYYIVYLLHSLKFSYM